MNTSLKQYQTLLRTYLGPLKRKVAVLAVLLFSSIGLQLLNPQIVGRFIDMAQAAAPVSALIGSGVLFLVVALIGQVVGTGAAYMTEDVKWRATNKMRGDLAEHCLALDMTFHHTNTPGSMIERIDGDVEELSNFFSQFVIQISGNVLLLSGVLVLMFREDWRIGLGFLGFSLLTFLSLSQTVRIAVPYWKSWRETNADMFGFLEERLAGAEDIRANGGVAYVMVKLHEAIYQTYLAARKAFVFGEMTWGSTNALFVTGTALALGLGSYLLDQGAITIGSLYLIFQYSTMLRRPIDVLARQIRDLQSSTASIQRIQELFEIKSVVQEVAVEIAQPLSTGALAVTFDRVSFGYNPDDLVLKDVSFRLKPGEVLGLLGRTGSGKTTITRLLFRLYDPTAGQIDLSGTPLPQSSLAELRRRVGIVTQDVQLFRASVRDNLTFFDDTLSDQTILDVIHDLGLGTWYAALSDGLDTRLDADGSGLSAGEAQLLAFARIFLKDPGLVILDEASSRLDPATEQLIERAIDRLLRGRTAIIVAHRLMTVQRADKIMILEDGQVREFGERVVLVNNPASRFAELLRTGLEQVLV